MSTTLVVPVRNRAVSWDDLGTLPTGCPDPDVIVAVWDRRLHEACARSGLTVAPAQIP